MLQEWYPAAWPSPPAGFPLPPAGAVTEPTISYEYEAVGLDFTMYCIQAKLLCLCAVRYETVI